MLVDLINEKSSKDNIRSNYNNFTCVEKIMVDRGYAWNDEAYPSLYWKIIAGIYYLIYKKDMGHIDRSFAFSSLEEDSNRIRSSSEIEQMKTKSIYDVYINFKLAYTPFRKNNIDTKLKKMGYPVEFLSSIKDKLILFVRDFAFQNKLHPVECQLCNHISFLLSLNFMSFFETLLNYTYEPINYIFDSPSYDILYYQSNIYKEERQKDFIKTNKNIVFDIVFKIFKNDYSRIILCLKKILSGDFMIRLDDLVIMMIFCRHLFNVDVANCYITDIMYMMKYREISPAIIMLFDSNLSFEYSMIDPSLVNIAKYSYKIDMTTLQITQENYIQIAGNCNSIEKFKSVLMFLKSNEWPVRECVVLFVVNIINNGFMKLNELIEIEPYIKEIIMEYRYNILASHIKNNRTELIELSLTTVKDWDLQDKRIIDATGESCNVDTLEKVYGKGPYSDDFINTIILTCYRKGSTVFADHFSHPIFTLLGFYDNKISDYDIVNALVESNNTKLIENFRFAINITTIDDLILKTIIANNFPMFAYFLKTISHHYLNIRKMIICAAINNRRVMLICLMNEYVLKPINNGNKENKENRNPSPIHFSGQSSDNNEFYLGILKQIVSSVSSDILGVFFNKMTYDYNDIKVQLFTMRKVIDKILKSPNRQWLEDNLRIFPIYYLESRPIKQKIFHYTDNSIYISSDEESDSDDEDKLFQYI